MSTHGRDRDGGRSSASADNTPQTLGDVMRTAPSDSPDVVVIDQTYDEKKRRDDPSLREDLWLTSADGRYNSTIIPLRVGRAPNQEVFQVHRDILVTTEYFRKALCGDFREAEAQSMDFPEEDPAIFHFLVAFLYQRSFVPIRPAASALGLDELERGKAAQQAGHLSDSESDISSSEASDATTRSRMRAQRRQRRRERQWERMNRKHPGTHRLDCRCPRCTTNTSGPPCWNCGVARARPMPGPMPHIIHPIPPIRPGGLPPHRRRRNRHQVLTPPGSTPSLGASATPGSDEVMDGDRIRGEDMRTWLLTYELSLDVYICANKFLMGDFKAVIQRHCVDMLESAGSDAAQSAVLQLCSKLYAGVPESDPLLRMIVARVGFLQPLLWQRAPQHTSEFLISHPEVTALIVREMALRREEDMGSSSLPSMERTVTTSHHAILVRPPAGPPIHPHMRPPPPPPPPHPQWHPAPFGVHEGL